MFISFLILTGICELYYEFTLKREWYLPFQKFRYKLVKLVDEKRGKNREDCNCLNLGKHPYRLEQ